MYEDIFLYSSKDFENLKLYAMPGAEFGLDFPKLNSSGSSYQIVTVSVKFGLSITLTGRFLQSSKGTTIYQCINNSSKQYGYVVEDNLDTWTNDVNNVNTIISCQDYLNELIANNWVILENNLMCARIINYCEQNGIALPSSARESLYNLHTKLIERNQWLLNSGFVKVQNSGESVDFSKYNSDLVSFMNNPKIGVLMVSFTALIITAVVVGVVASAITFGVTFAMLKEKKKESSVHIKYSDELMADLIKHLPPNTLNQLMKENDANENIFNRAINGSGSNIWTSLKYIGAGLAGFYILNKLFRSQYVPQAVRQ